MLSKEYYEIGVKLHEQIKYNINYDKEPLFKLVCSGFASRLLSLEYVEELSQEQIDMLNNLK
jgi:hypothetical protein